MSLIRESTFKNKNVEIAALIFFNLYVDYVVFGMTWKQANVRRIGKKAKKNEAFSCGRNGKTPKWLALHVFNICNLKHWLMTSYCCTFFISLYVLLVEVMFDKLIHKTNIWPTIETQFVISCNIFASFFFCKHSNRHSKDRYKMHSWTQIKNPNLTTHIYFTISWQVSNIGNEAFTFAINVIFKTIFEDNDFDFTFA